MSRSVQGFIASTYLYTAVGPSKRGTSIDSETGFISHFEKRETEVTNVRGYVSCFMNRTPMQVPFSRDRLQAKMFFQTTTRSQFSVSRLSQGNHSDERKPSRTPRSERYKEKRVAGDCGLYWTLHVRLSIPFFSKGWLDRLNAPHQELRTPLFISPVAVEWRLE